MRTDRTVCLNSRVDGRQPSLEDRIYWPGGVAPAVTTCFFYNVLVYEEERQVHDGGDA